LSALGLNTSLRHAIQLLSPAFVLAQAAQADKVAAVVDFGIIQECSLLFLSAKASAEL